MTTVAGSYFRDANRVPITTNGLTVVSTQTLSGSNATVATPVFTLTGSVEVKALWAVVTTALGTNVTAGYYRLNDQTAQSSITLSTGTTLSAAPVGSIWARKGLVNAAISLNTSAQERVADPNAIETPYWTPCLLVGKDGALTQIEFVYTTTDTPTSGVVQHFISYVPLSTGANLVAV